MNSSSTLINALFIFVLAGFIGFEVIRRVSPLLHTPLMSLTNALDAIASSANANRMDFLIVET